MCEHGIIGLCHFCYDNAPQIIIDSISELWQEIIKAEMYRKEIEQ